MVHEFTEKEITDIIYVDKCKPALEWLEKVGDRMQHGLKLGEDDTNKLTLVMRHTADICKRCKCPEEK